MAPRTCRKKPVGGQVSALGSPTEIASWKPVFATQAGFERYRRREGVDIDERESQIRHRGWGERIGRR
jgi:hypothetical protein